MNEQGIEIGRIQGKRLELEKELQKYKDVYEAAKRMMNFDLEQYHLHKAAGDYEHRDKNTLDLLGGIAKLEGESDGWRV